MIRPARPDELQQLADIEDAAAQLFADTPMAFVLAFGPAPVKQAESIDEPVLVWVSCDDADRAVGFLEAEIIDGWLHIVELSVHPDCQRQGRARALVDVAAAAARFRGLDQLSLTTDRAIAWNGPAYLRMGFAELPRGRCPDWLVAMLDHEVSVGFDSARRIAMARTP